MTQTALPQPPAASDTDPERRRWLLATSAVGVAAAGAAAVPFVASLAPSERARAAGAPVEVEVGDIAPGAMKTVEWRGRPVWILRRTAEQLAQLSGHDAQLVDPHSAVSSQQPDYARGPGRSRQPDLFVAIGICTHLGCSPSLVPAGQGGEALGADWPGGFFCPCHGSTFDLAGRVFRNKPAPTNLEIPPYRFVSATRILIGEEDAA